MTELLELTFFMPTQYCFISVLLYLCRIILCLALGTLDTLDILRHFEMALPWIDVPFWKF